MSDKSAFKSAVKSIRDSIKVLKRKRAEAVATIAEIDRILGSFKASDAPDPKPSKPNKGGAGKKDSGKSKVFLVLEAFSDGKEHSALEVAKALAQKHGGNVDSYKVTIYNLQKQGKLAKGEKKGTFKRVNPPVDIDLGVER